MKKTKKTPGLYAAILSVMLIVCSYQADAQNWLVAGNAAGSSNFLGTTNAQDLRFRTNNTQKMVLTQTGSLGIGTQTPTSKLDVVGGGGGTVDFKVNGRILTGDAVNAGGMWCNSGLTQFIGQLNSSTLGLYNNGWALSVGNSGKIGIGTSAPAYKLHVISNEKIGTWFRSTYSGQEQYAAVGVDATEVPGNVNSLGIGVNIIAGWVGLYSLGYGENTSSSSTTYGVRGFATGLNTIGTKYAIYGQADHGTVNYAGYFDGNLYATQYFSPSDKRLKNNIQPLNGGLDKLMLLKPSTYDYKTEEFSNMNLPTSPQNGLVADELEKVFPELVQEQVQPPVYGKDKKEVIKPEMRFKGVNYIGLIPVMISSIQEQQAKINSQDAKIEKLEKEIVALQKGIISSIHENSNSINLNGAYLHQNAPNPFSENTSISYFVPEAANSAVIKIYSFKGEELRSCLVTEKGKGSLIVNAGSLSQGTYTYQLIVNSQIIDTKLMVITN